MSETDLQTALDAVTTVPGKSAAWYARRLDWPVSRVRYVMHVLSKRGLVDPRRVWVYEVDGGKGA